MVVYDGTDKVLPTMSWSSGLPVTYAPFYFNGMTNDEFFVEECYRNYYYARLAPNHMAYKTVRKQLEDGDIDSIPDEYKISCPYPEDCTAYSDLVLSAKAG